MAGKYTIRSKGEKLDIVKQVLAGKSRKSWEPGIRHSVVTEWVKKYLVEGEAGLVLKERAENPLLRYQNSSKKPGLEHVLHPNLLNSDFSTPAPLQKIFTDVTYLKFCGKRYYFVTYLDLFNNEILEWDLSDTFDNFLVLRPAQQLLQKISQQTESTASPVLLHRDQGAQYSSVGFTNLLAQYHT